MTGLGFRSDLKMFLLSKIKANQNLHCLFITVLHVTRTHTASHTHISSNLCSTVGTLLAHEHIITKHSIKHLLGPRMELIRLQFTVFIIELYIPKFMPLPASNAFIVQFKQFKEKLLSSYE